MKRQRRIVTDTELLVPGFERQCLRAAFIFLTVLFTVMLPRIAASQATYYYIHYFGLGTDGTVPKGAVAFDHAGNIYGATGFGGAHAAGMIWKMTPAGVYSDLHDFVNNGVDGVHPYAGVTIDASGNLYGTTSGGGIYSCGTVWELSAGGGYTVLHVFGADNTAYPNAGVTVDGLGNLYGTTSESGGTQNGAVWKMTPAGAFYTFSILHFFGGTITASNGDSGPDGSSPAAGVTLDSSGNLYGTCYGGGYYRGAGGAFQPGMVWEITSTGRYKDLHDFGGYVLNSSGVGGRDGWNPMGGVAFDASGNMFGTTSTGGQHAASSQSGVVWEITANSQYKDLHDFGGVATLSNGASGPDGADPLASVVTDAAGDVFGTASYGGQFPSAGIVWVITKAGAYADLHDFGGSVTDSSGDQVWDGTDPESPISFDAYGNMYGATSGRGTNTCVVWVLTGTLSQISVSPNPITGGVSAAGRATFTMPAPVRGYSVALSGTSTAGTVPTSVVVPAGSLSGKFNIATSVVAAVTNDSLTATTGSVSKTTTFQVNPPPISNLSLSSASVYGGLNGTGTITLAVPAPSGGCTVSLASTSSDATVPSTVSVPSGKTSATFTVTTMAVPSSTLVNIRATLGPTSSTTILTIIPPAVSSVSVPNSSILGGTSYTGLVVLTSPAATGGVSVNLVSNSAAVVVPSSITVSAKMTAASFLVAAKPVSAQTAVKVTAQINGNPQTVSFVVVPPAITAITASPAQFPGGDATSVTVTLNGPAPGGGMTVILGGTSQYIHLPGSVVVPAGKTSVTFAVPTSRVPTSQTAQVLATAGGRSLRVLLTLLYP